MANMLDHHRKVLEAVCSAVDMHGCTRNPSVRNFGRYADLFKLKNIQSTVAKMEQSRNLYLKVRVRSSLWERCCVLKQDNSSQTVLRTG